MSSGSPDAAATPSGEELARANVETIARTVTPDREPPKVAFTPDPIFARFHYASDTLWFDQDLIPPLAQGAENPVVRALVAHELGHRRDGPPGISTLPLPALLTATALLLATCFAFVLDHPVVGSAALGIAAACLFVLLVRARWMAEYRCDDFAAERTGPDGVIALLDILAATPRDRATRGAGVRWRIRLAFQWLTHPPSRWRARRQRARAAAACDR